MTPRSSLLRPSEAQLGSVAAELSRSRFSYAEPGLTHPEHSSAYPDSFHVDERRVFLGNGEAVFERASRAIFTWQMYATSWTQLFPVTPPVKGSVHCVSAAHFGLYSLNPVRVVYTIKAPVRAGFAVGTLPGHAESGEERFLVEAENDKVYFSILAVSKPAGLLVRLAAPFARRIQQRFFADAVKQIGQASRAES